MRARAAAVAASSRWTDADGVRAPAGEAHAWEPGTNQTVCGPALSRSQLERFPHVSWDDLLASRTGERVQRVCPRCRGATRRREPREARRWSPPDTPAEPGPWASPGAPPAD